MSGPDRSQRATKPRIAWRSARTSPGETPSGVGFGAGREASAWAGFRILPLAARGGRATTGPRSMSSASQCKASSADRIVCLSHRRHGPASLLTVLDLSP